MTPSRFWELTPVMADPHYIPDAQEIAEMKAVEDAQKEYSHKNFDNEDGCLDCGYYVK